jgi:hypothetical protein
MRRGEFPGIATVDLLLNLVMAFTVLLSLSIMAMSTNQEPPKTDHVQQDALYLIKVRWAGESNDDVDTYVMNPLGQILFFKQKEIGLMNLNRDDTGREANTITLADGRVVTSEFNEETASIRGIIEGEYTVNVHLYRASDKTPVDVVVTLYKVANGGDIQLHDQKVTLDFQGDEKTAFRFTLMKNGDVVGINRLPKLFVQKTKSPGEL